MKIKNYPFCIFLVSFLILGLVTSCVNETSVLTQTPSPLITTQYPTTLNMLQTTSITPSPLITTQCTPTLNMLQTKTITPFPTDYPLIWVALEQTRVAALQSPTPPPGGALIWPGPTPDPIQLELPLGTPLGEGVLTEDVGMHMSQYMGSFYGNLLAWVTETEDGKAILVYAGVDANDQEQGLLYVVREGTIWDYFGDRIKLPARSGRPDIINAVGKRLIIETEDRDTFYFDVPAGQFAASLTEILPTMTPGPTLTPRVTATFPSGDDVANEMNVSSLWSINKDLTFFINPGDDEDWFLFYLPSSSDIVISLRDLPVPCGLVWITNSVFPTELGSDMNPSLNDKVIQIQDAEAGYYAIGVVALTDAFSSNNPYTLRFSKE